MRKIVVIGIDGLSAKLVEQLADDMPTLMEMQTEGSWGSVKSSIPPHPIPAWICAQTGRDPSYYNVWDSIYYDPYNYENVTEFDSTVFGTSLDVNFRRDERDPLYRILMKRGKKVAISNITLSWPPPRITGGYCVSKPTSMTTEQNYTWPPSFKNEVEEVFGDLSFVDIDSQIRTGQADLEKIFKQLKMSDQKKLDLVKHFISNKKCEFVFTHLDGAGRVLELFMRYWDSHYENYLENEKYAELIREYFQFVDEELAEIKELLDELTILLIHSVNGVQERKGSVYLNQWLFENGYLKLKKNPERLTSFNYNNVDWQTTHAWSVGSMGQIYLNVKGRRRQGLINKDQYSSFVDEISSKLLQIKKVSKGNLDVKIIKRMDIYTDDKSIYGPDLFMIFDNYAWDINASIGTKDIFSKTFKTVLDYTTIGEYGYFCINGPWVPHEIHENPVPVIDFAPTVLEIMGLEIPDYMEGKPFMKLMISREEEGKMALEERLKWLGY